MNILHRGDVWSAPHLVSGLVLCLRFELCTLRAPQGPAPVQATKKSGSKAILVHSNHTHLTPVVMAPCRKSSGGGEDYLGSVKLSEDTIEACSH